MKLTIELKSSDPLAFTWRAANQRWLEALTA
jgi:hypothetical protein